MLTKKELLKYPNYLTKKFQNEIYRQLVEYMEKNNLSQKEVAKKLGVSSSYVSQILNGNFNFTLTKLIELGLFIGKVPKIEFVGVEEFEEEIKEINEEQKVVDPHEELFRRTKERVKKYRANTTPGLMADQKEPVYKKKRNV